MINWSFHHNFKNIYTYPEQPRKGWELSELFGQQCHLLSLESLQRMFQILFQFSLKSCQFTNLIKDVKDDIIRATQGAAPKHREVANDSRSWKLVEGELSFRIVAAFLHPCQGFLGQTVERLTHRILINCVLLTLFNFWLSLRRQNQKPYKI